jgi:catalase (peroxidase I)
LLHVAQLDEHVWSHAGPYVSAEEQLWQVPLPLRPSKQADEQAAGQLELHVAP